MILEDPFAPHIEHAVVIQKNGYLYLHCVL